MTVSKGQRKNNEKKEGVFGQLRRGDAFVMLRMEQKFNIDEEGNLNTTTFEKLVCSGYFRSMKQQTRPILTYLDVVRKRQMREYCVKGDVLVKCSPDFARAYRMASKL